MSQNGSSEDATSEDVEWISTSEAVRRTGLSRSTLFKLVNEGKLAAYRPSRNFQFKAREVDEFIEQSRVKPGELDDMLRRNWLPNYKRP